MRNLDILIKLLTLARKMQKDNGSHLDSCKAIGLFMQREPKNCEPDPSLHLVKGDWPEISLSYNFADGFRAKLNLVMYKTPSLILFFLL